MATFWAKIPHRNIVSELDFFKNQIANYRSLVSRRKSSFEQEYPTDPLDREPARQAAITLAGKY